MTKRLLNFSSNVIHHRRFDRFPFFSRLPSENGSFLLDRGRDRNCSAVTTALLAKALRVSMQSAIPAGLLAPLHVYELTPPPPRVGIALAPLIRIPTHSPPLGLPNHFFRITLPTAFFGCRIYDPLCTRWTHCIYLGEKLRNIA